MNSQVGGQVTRERVPPAFIAVSVLLFLASAGATCLKCNSMSAMGALPLPGGGSVSMMWMPMQGGTWAGTFAEFMGMWLIMMTAMMLPSFAPTLWLRYTCSLGSPSGRVRHATLLILGYLCTWLIVGSGVFVAGVLFTHWELEQPLVAKAVPMAAGVLVLVGAALQCSAWKARQLACCREARACADIPRPSSRRAFQWGLRHGLHCGGCCASFNMAMLAIGAMELKAMALVTVVITVERLAPNAKRTAHVIGLLMGVAGVYVLACALRD
jgi:predicted metal-binding membrane protein